MAPTRINRFRIKAFLFFVTLLLCDFSGQSARAQFVHHVPEDHRNSRCMTDVSHMEMRAQLTFAGVSGENRRDLGLQQYVNHAAGGRGNPAFATIEKIIEMAGQSIPQDPDIHHIEHATNILQYLAFEAMAALLIEQNGEIPGQSMQFNGVHIRPHTEVIEQLRAALVTLSEGDKLVPKHSAEQPFVDYLDALRSYYNTARAVDLYLGIENAYSFYGLDDGPLLSLPEKRVLMKRMNEDLHLLYDQGIKKQVSFAEGSITIRADEMEAGNRPLKAYLALGYASLAIQYEREPEQERSSEYLSEAILRASHLTQSAERDLYWAHQTGNGEPYWAEGPYYFDFVLKDAVAFWHVVRELNTQPLPEDPFHSSWFLNPVLWLAGLSTPDGSLPPLDDGNKRPVQSARMLRWTPDYGDGYTGSLFATIHQKQELYLSEDLPEDQYYLVEAAIPRMKSAAAELPPLKDSDGMQLVIRRTDAENGSHYLLLNGQRGQATDAGEGHEQPDQLQLIYFSDHQSYLVDPGYDRGYTRTNSSWNGYLHTNTMQYNAADIRHTAGFVTTQNEGGLQSPYVSVSDIRKVSVHHPADLVYDQPSPETEVLKGSVQLEFERPESSIANYQRTVIAVAGEHPYVIDINDIEAITGRKDFVMRYHGNSDRTLTENGWFSWATTSGTDARADRHLFLHTSPLAGNYRIEEAVTEIQESVSRTAGGYKVPWPIVRKSFISTEESPRFVTAGFLSIRKEAPAAEPLLYRTESGLHYLWFPLDSERVDILVYAMEPVAQPRLVEFDSGPAKNLRFEMKAGEGAAFARLQKSEEGWTQLKEFTAYLKLLTEAEQEPVGEHRFLLAYPNPASDFVTLHYQIPESAEVLMELYDSIGRRVTTILDETQTAGAHETTWSTSGLATGIYMVRLTSTLPDGQAWFTTRKITVIQ